MKVTKIIIVIIYIIFIFGRAGSLELLGLFSSCGKWGLLASCGGLSSHCSFSGCGVWGLLSRWVSGLLVAWRLLLQLPCSKSGLEQLCHRNLLAPRHVGSSQPRDPTQASRIAARFFTN